MRLVAWNCKMALHRKVDALLALRPDVAVISECAEPERLRTLSRQNWIEGDPAWIGQSATKRYRSFLTDGPAVVAGDFNGNAIWDKPGWRINHTTRVATLGQMGLVSAYHAVTQELQGQETTPTLYWRDRTRDGPTYHIDYVFMPAAWIDKLAASEIGSFDNWCGNGSSDHVPVVVDVRP